MWPVKFFADDDGREPVSEWLNSGELSAKDKTSVENKLQKLSENGHNILINTNMLDNISGDDPNMYEIRHNKCRVIVYFDEQKGEYIALHGFIKRKQKENIHIEYARRLLNSYMAEK